MRTQCLLPIERDNTFLLRISINLMTDEHSYLPESTHTSTSNIPKFNAFKALPLVHKICFTQRKKKKHLHVTRWTTVFSKRRKPNNEHTYSLGTAKTNRTLHWRNTIVPRNVALNTEHTYSQHGTAATVKRCHAPTRRAKKKACQTKLGSALTDSPSA